MTDPCGIVDTIQSNLQAMEIESAAKCIGAEDTTTALPESASSMEEVNREGSSSNNADTPDDDTTNDSPNDGQEVEETTKNKETAKEHKITGFLRKFAIKTKDDESDASTGKNEEEKKEEPPKMAPVSDLSDLSRKICVVTTAGLPWRTGTAVNPLARALYLTRGRPKHSVTLMIPWLETREEQAKVYGSNVFDSPEEQEA